MNGYNPLAYFLLVLKASLFSTGGMGNLPSVQDDLVAHHHWATDRQIAESLAISQVAPGPSGLWILSLGYLVDGLRGLLLALLAISLPPLLVLIVERLFRRLGDHPAAVGFVRGLSLAIVGTTFTVLSRLIASEGIRWQTFLLAGIGIGLGALRRLPPLLILLIAAVAGIFVYR